jgi:hypothetical protein
MSEMDVTPVLKWLVTRIKMGFLLILIWRQAVTITFLDDSGDLMVSVSKAPQTNVTIIPMTMNNDQHN